jgi:hypothetical protein
MSSNSSSMDSGVRFLPDLHLILSPFPSSSLMETRNKKSSEFFLKQSLDWNLSVRNFL